jgi:hypothetical protein
MNKCNRVEQTQQDIIGIVSNASSFSHEPLVHG